MSELPKELEQKIAELIQEASNYQEQLSGVPILFGAGRELQLKLEAFMQDNFISKSELKELVEGIDEMYKSRKVARKLKNPEDVFAAVLKKLRKLTKEE